MANDCGTTAARDAANVGAMTEDEINAAELMLVRAGVVNDTTSDRAYFREKPWKWAREVVVCKRLETEMAKAGVDPSEGWDMTLTELIQRSVARGV